MDVAAWLRGLGLEQYTQLFRDNDIDGEILSGMTAEDLKELGISSFGHRRRLLNAITALGGEASTRDVAQSATSVTSAPTSPPPIDAERRQLTVMFCDLVGSTALSARLDPEDLREVVAAYHRVVADVVRSFDGFVAKYMGDGVLAYFGYPSAHEDDAERAVRAGLGAIDAVGRLNVGSAKLQARIGIATGQVVVGDLIGAGAAQEQAVVGATPNLAARLQALAEPNSVVIAASTRRLLGDLFEYRDLGTVTAKGFIEPVPGWQVLQVSAVESRFEAFHATAAALTPLVGREEEIELLLRRWWQARSCDGRVVLFSGEPGIGKSRLTRAIQESISSEPHIRLLYVCSPHHQASALFPFIAQLERAAGFARDDPPEAKLDKLETLLAQSANEVARDAAILAELLSVPSGRRYPPLDLSPQKRKERTLQVLLAQLRGLAARQPVLVIFEDAHWIDPTSLELLDLTVDEVQSLPVLLIITFRPEFQPPWVGRPHVTMHPLTRLSRREVSAMIERVTGKALPEELLAQIVARTDGVPLFVEELTKAVLESDLLRSEGDAYVLAAPLPMLAIPSTLHASLMARLDRLSLARRVAEVGAAIGREFSYELIAAVSEAPESELNDALQQLVASELVYRRGTPPEAVYSFKHALVQDAAYSTLLRRKRQELHARIAKTLEERLPETVAAQPELLAHHFTEAGRSATAIEWWSKAGDRALQRSAYKEAVAHLGRAIELAEGLADAPAQRLLRLRLQIAYGQALIAARGHGARETTGAFVRAREIAAGIDMAGVIDASERFSVYYGLWVGSVVRGELAPMTELAEIFLRDAERHPGLPEAGIAHRVFGSTRWFQGDFLGAKPHLEQAVAAYDVDRDRHLALRFGQDVGVPAMLYLANMLFPIGEIDRARLLVNAASAHALRSEHVPTICFGDAHTCVFEALCQDPVRAMPHAERLALLSREHGLPLWLAYGVFLLGWAHWHAGDREMGEAEMREGAELWRAQGNSLHFPLLAALQAEAAAESGRVEVGLGALAEGLAETERSGQKWYEAELHRKNGEIFLRRRPSDVVTAEMAFLRAISIARRQQAKTFELRASMSLARLRREQGRRAEARDLLAPVYDWFTQGFDTADLKEAKALLDELT